MTHKKDLDNVGSESDLRDAAEAQLGKVPDVSHELKDLTSEKIIHELRVHQIELEMQNDELRRLQLESEASRTKYQDLYDFSLVGYFTLTQKGLIIQANLAGASLFGMPRPKLIHMGFGHFVDPESEAQLYRHFLSVLKQGHKQDFDLTLKRGDGSSFYARLESIRTNAPVEQQKANGATHAIRMAVIDITDRKKAENAMRLSEEKFRGMFESHSAVMLLVEPDTGRIALANKAAERFYGYTASQLVSMYIQDINVLPPDEVMTEMNLALHELRNLFIFPHRLANGEVRTVQVHSSPIDHNGELMLFSIIHDITDRKQAEDALRESQKNFLTLFETMDDIIVIGDTDGKILHANAAALRKLDYGPEELKAMHILDLHPREKRHEAETIFAEMFKGERDVCPLPLAKKDGVYLPVETRVWFAKWSGKDCIFGISKDLSREQEALQKFNKFFELNPAPMAVSSLSDRKFMEVNESWLNTLGFSRDEVIGKTSAELGILVDPEKQQDFAKRLLDQGSVRDIELQIRKKDGTILEGIFSGETIDSQGRNYFVTAMLDVTERKRLEQKRLDMERKLLHAQKLESLGVMAGGIAHDFNNLLQVVLGNLDIALDNTPPDSKVRQSILNAIQASERSAKLSGQMLTYSGSSFHIPKEIDLNELLNKSRNLFKSYIHENTILKYDVSKTLPRIKGDQDQIQRLINNLVVNALEAIGEKQGEVRVSAGTVECDEEYLSGNRLDIKLEPGVLVFLEVSDTGDGMDDKTLQRLFDPFFSTKFWGRGLGMAEVMGIGKAHHGAIFVDSETGKGTTIRVLFPVSEKVQESPIQVKGAVETKPAAPVSPTGRKTILVVDDEEMVRGLVLGRLEVLGYDTIAAVDGAEGVHIFREHMNEIDLVILDFAMPKMNGVEAFEELIRIKPEVKVILSSGYTEDAVMQSFPGQRPAGVLHKPYKMEDLKTQLERLLGTDG